MNHNYFGIQALKRGNFESINPYYYNYNIYICIPPLFHIVGNTKQQYLVYDGFKVGDVRLEIPDTFQQAGKSEYC